MAVHEKEKPENKYKDTLNLPRTDFPIRPNAAIDDPALIARWETEKLYEKSFNANKGEEKFILHDGPPYANGHIHVGHAYNKILKDIITKSRRMLGMHVPVTPGWDCHGLPIELKVTQEKPGLEPQALKKACREYANHWIDTQRQEFKRLGVLMNWNHPYLTMNYGYEASILKVFSSFIEQGFIERKNKTVPWCMFDQTVLAAAEIEYQDRKDPSLYVLFSVEKSVVQKLWPELASKDVSFAVWTTTPWTLPLNRALLIKPHTQYAVVEKNPDQYVIIAKDLVEKLGALLEQPLLTKHVFSSEHLLQQNPRAHHPFIADVMVPVIPSDTVQLGDGTAIVHCAPGCGPEDYEVGVKHNLEIYSPISGDGKYTAEIKPAELQGMAVTDGQIWVIKALAASNRLLHKGSIRHSYPHCWRCRNGLIFRATKQWFCNLDRDSLKQHAITAVDGIAMIPEGSANRFKATLGGRLEWCLSRQRIWGVPIPALLCSSCDYTHTTPELIEKVAKEVEKKGVEYWDTVAIDQLVPAGFACPKCVKNAWIKEKDILDVWFDSGVSHYAVLSQNPDLRFPADMYLEGKDQHRGWFQSSLLTALVFEKQAPMKCIVTHGFTVDDQGRKMSKSLGNVVTPAQMIEQLGTDGLRLWASSIDYTDDAVVSPVLIENVKEVYRKVRNTSRFLLSNLYDFDIKKDAIAVQELSAIDTYALHELILINAQVIDAYERYDFTAVFHLLSDYCAKNLSALYLDIIKDRLYVEQADGYKRRSAQTVCWYILDTMTRLMAPILSFTAEYMSDHYQKDKKDSIHLQQFASLVSLFETLNSDTKSATAKNQSFDKKALQHIKETLHENVYMQLWQELLSMRSAVLKAIEKLREQGTVKHSLEARLTLYWDDAMKNGKALRSFFESIEKKGDKQSVAAFLKEFFIVSQVVIASDATSLNASEYPGLSVFVERALGHKCPRCWHWDQTDHPDHLCARCQAVVK